MGARIQIRVQNAIRCVDRTAALKRVFLFVCFWGFFWGGSWNNIQITRLISMEIGSIYFYNQIPKRLEKVASTAWKLKFTWFIKTKQSKNFTEQLAAPYPKCLLCVCVLFYDAAGRENEPIRRIASTSYEKLINGSQTGNITRQAKEQNSWGQNAIAHLNIIKQLPGVQTTCYGNNLKSSELLFLSNLRERRNSVIGNHELLRELQSSQFNLSTRGSSAWEGRILQEQKLQQWFHAWRKPVGRNLHE